MNAVLIECPDLDEDSKVTADYKCEDKIIATIRMKRNGKPCDEMGKVLLLDEVFHKKLKSKAKLMSPYLIQIKNGDPIVMYPLDFVDTVSCPNCTGNEPSPASLNPSNDMPNRNKKSYLSPNGRINNYDNFFHELDADTDKVKGNMKRYLESEDFYDDVKNGHKSGKVEPIELNRDTKNSDCYCTCPTCGEYSGLDRCNCCYKCNRYRNPCHCRECAYVDDSLKCECCASLSSCRNGLCSFNGAHFICENGLCHSSGESWCGGETDYDEFNNKIKKLAKEPPSFKFDNKYNNFKQVDSNDIDFDPSPNNNYKEHNTGNIEDSPKTYYNFPTNEELGLTADNNYKNRKTAYLDNSYNYPVEKHQNNPNLLRFNGFDENKGKKRDGYLFNYDSQDSDSFDAISKKRNERNEIYYDSNDDDENDFDDDFQLNTDQFNENYNEDGMPVGNQKNDDNQNNEIDKPIDFRKRKVSKPEKKKHHHAPIKLKNADIKYPYKKSNSRRNLELAQPLQLDQPLQMDQPLEMYQPSGDFPPSNKGSPELKIYTNQRYTSPFEKVPYGEFLGDHYLNDDDKMKLINTMDFNYHDIDTHLNQLLLSNNDKTIVEPDPYKKCFRPKPLENKYFIRWRKNANSKLPPQHRPNSKLRKRSLYSYESDNNFIDNIENEFENNYSTKFTKRKDNEETKKGIINKMAIDDDIVSAAKQDTKRGQTTKRERVVNKKKVKQSKVHQQHLGQDDDAMKDNKNENNDEDEENDSKDDIDELNEEAVDAKNDGKINGNEKLEKGNGQNENKEDQNVIKEEKSKKNDDDTKSGDSKRSLKNMWFSVFNMSAPLRFLTVQIHIFRKQNNTWRKIAQPLLLTSSSRIYANNNLSIIFSFHSDYINLENTLDHNRFKLLLPNNTINNKNNHHQNSSLTGSLIDPTDMLTIDTRKIPIHDKALLHANTPKLCEAQAMLQTMKYGEDLVTRTRREKEMGIHILDDVGKVEKFEKYSIVQNCMNSTNKTCLNVLNKEIPGHKIEIKIPFIQNSVILPSVDFIRISNIIVDGSSLELLGITILVTNFGLKAAQYKIAITKCVPEAINGDNIKHKKLLPHIGLKTCFKLPIQAILEYGVKEVMCEVQVESSEDQIVAKRQFPVRPQSRCFCIWSCACSCITSFAMADSAEICTGVKASEYKKAGFSGAFLQDEEDNSSFDWTAIIVLMALLLIFLLMLGFIKAILGLCIRGIGHWRYDYLQPNQRYDASSHGRRFFINSIFFLVFPCVCCCYCFEPKEEDELLINGSSTWQKSIIQNEITYGIDDDENEPESDDELAKLLAESEKVSEPYTKQKTVDSNSGGTGITTYNDEDEEKDTSFVLSALTESRESLKLIEGHHSEDNVINKNPKYADAVALVKKLLEAKIVYRIFNEPVGDVAVNKNQKFSIRGYFLPSLGPGYDFITPSPLKQYWSITEGKSELTPLTPPKVLNQVAFTFNYKNKIEVIEKNELVLIPDLSAPCINVVVQDANMYKFKE